MERKRSTLNQDRDAFIKTLKNRLRHNYEKTIMGIMNTKEKNKGQNKLRTYCKFKMDHKQENYLTTISDSRIGTSVTKMRLSAHHLMIEKGRHLHVNDEDRLCKSVT